jgi:hypothetical protein
MDNIPVHLRITGLNVTNEDVDSRRKAATELGAAWGKVSDVQTLLSKSAEIAASLGGDGHPPPDLGAEVEIAVQKHASAFLYAERPLEVGICAGTAVLSVLKPEPGSNGWQIPDVYSNALWLALSYQPSLQDEKRENLRLEVLTRSRDRSLASANKARERSDVPEVGELTITTGDDAKTTTNFKKTVNGVVDALRRNAALDREELDFLWWVQLGRSRLLNRQLSQIPEAVRLVAAGIEGASYLRRLPADVHRDIVLRTLDADPKLDLKELIKAIGADRAALSLGLSSAVVTASPQVFPLLTALITGVAEGAGAETKRSASDWGVRALLEAGLNAMRNTGPRKL